MNLEERLEQVQVDNPRGFPESSFDRVRSLLAYSATHTQTDYRLFLEDLSDWQLLIDLIPELEGKTPGQITRERVPILNGSSTYSLYASSKNWIRETAQSPYEKNKLSVALFPNQRVDRREYQTEDWRQEFSENQTWQEMGFNGFKQNKESGGKKYWNACTKWIRRETDDEIERARLRHQIFGCREWKIYQTVEDWQNLIAEEFPHLVGLKRDEFVKDPNGKAIDKELYRWAKITNPNDSKKALAIAHQVIERSKLDGIVKERTLQAWEDLYLNSEHFSKSPGEMQKDVTLGGNALYQGIRKHALREAKTSFEKASIVGRIFNLENYLSGFFSSLDERPKTLNEAVEVVRPVNLRYRALTRNLRALATTIFPEFLYDHIEEMKKPGYSPENKSWKAADKVLDSLHVLKLAQSEGEDSISQSDYFRFVREVFSDEDLIDAKLGDHSEEVSRYIAKGDFSDVSIIDEEVQEGRSPTYRTRMLLATNQEIQSNTTLDAFVKFYPSEMKNDLQFDVALNNYLATVAGVKSVGKARTAKLGKAIMMQRESESRPGEENYTYTIKTVGAVTDRNQVPCSQALVTQFANVQNLEDYVSEFSAEEKMETLAAVNDAMCDLHVAGAENISRISEMEDSQREVLENNLLTPKGDVKFTDYVAESHLLFAPGSQLDEIYNWQLGISKILNTSARKYHSLIQGDLHTKNVVVNEEGKVINLDFELEFSGFGAPQVDQAKLYSYKTLKLNMQQKDDLVEDYAQKRGVTDLDEYREGFHAAVIYKTLVHTKYVVDNVASYGHEQAVKAIDQDVKLIEKHARRMPITREQREQLVGAIRDEYQIKESVGSDVYELIA